MHPRAVNILRIFAFSLELGHSNFNNTLFQWFCVFLGAPCINQRLFKVHELKLIFNLWEFSTFSIG